MVLLLVGLLCLPPLISGFRAPATESSPGQHSSETVIPGLAGERPGEGDLVIGLLVASLSEDDAFSTSARQGAELAVQLANASGGYQGKPYRLEVRSCEGPWGVTSREVVSMVYDEDALAIVASADGRNTHLAEQVATKTQVLLLSAWSADPTLSRAYVPWFYHCVPDDAQQADALLHMVLQKKGHKNVIILVEESYDARMSADYMQKAVTKSGLPRIEHTTFDAGDKDPEAIARKALASGPDALILLGESPLCVKIVRYLKQLRPSLGLYGNLGLLRNSELVRASGVEGMVFISPEYWFSAMGKRFEAQFQKLYNRKPEVAAAYAFDAVNLVIESVRLAGADRESIRKGFPDIRFADGVTGPFRFNSLGVRDVPTSLFRVQGGSPAPVLP